MMEIDESILDHMMSAVIIADAAGEILKMNGPATSLVGMANKPYPRHIGEIDPLFRRGMPIEFSGPRNIKIGNESRKAHVYTLKKSEGRKEYVYILDSADILREIDFDSFLDCIDDGIAIVNKDGTIEHVNRALVNLTGINNWKHRNMFDVINKKEMSRSLSIEILKHKKSMDIIQHFTSGETVLMSGIPVYGSENEVEYVIITGRDITKLTELEESLKKTEELKEKYYNRLSELEALVGADKIVHSSDVMKRVILLAGKAAKSESSVLIWGETGVGKELIAKLIHDQSKRKEKKFFGINCSAIPHDLLESQFFGYEDGSFTGAKKGGAKGIFEDNNGGTIFLDEISELPSRMQSKLLRVLQENEFVRVGGTKVIPFKSRIIAATNLSREQLNDESLLRRDLFYRLNVISIYIPPLRERKEDIMPLIRYFLNKYNHKYNTEIRFSKGLTIRLHGYAWPGNVRELKNVIERLVVNADSNEVSNDELDFLDEMEIPSDNQKNISIEKVMPLKSAFQIVEEMLIKKAYKKSGTITGAADILEIDPSTIHRKLKKGALQLARD